jgi:hypothetical protein
MTDLPAPSAVMARAIDAAARQDYVGAGVWLDIARELRAGRAGRVPVESDATAIMEAVNDRPTCRACGEETFIQNGRQLHRATYAFECVSR